MYWRVDDSGFFATALVRADSELGAKQALINRMQDDGIWTWDWEPETQLEFDDWLLGQVSLWKISKWDPDKELPEVFFIDQFNEL